ncbi:MAG TPA: hypothetical protein VKM55_11510 [Candidatus Lokiarchaeia archaeon]|nr:hypothetical protein [Candidatus Lokiarchaeia archaeon]
MPDQILEMFDDMLRRVEFKYGLDKIKVIVVEAIPELELDFNENKENKAFKFGPYQKDAIVTVPVWLMKLLKAKGYVVVHKDERMDDVVQASSDKTLAPLTGYFYNKVFDWLDTVEKLTEKGMVSDQMAKKFRSRFLSFYDMRMKQLLNSLSIPATSAFFKNLSQEEQVLIKIIHDLLTSWEKSVFKK